MTNLREHGPAGEPRDGLADELPEELAFWFSPLFLTHRSEILGSMAVTPEMLEDEDTEVNS